MSDRRTAQLLSLILLGVILAGCGTGGQSGDETQAQPVRLSRQAAEAESTLVHRGMHGLERVKAEKLPPLPLARTEPRPMPAQTRRAVTETIGPVPRFRLDFDHAYYAKTPLGLGIWMVLGRGVTCLFLNRYGNSTCGTTLAARRKGLSLGLYGHKGSDHPKAVFVVVGVVPAGVTGVSVRVGHGKETVRVQGHTWGVRSSQPAAEIHLIR